MASRLGVSAPGASQRRSSGDRLPAEAASWPRPARDMSSPGGTAASPTISCHACKAARAAAKSVRFFQRARVRRTMPELPRDLLIALGVVKAQRRRPPHLLRRRRLMPQRPRRGPRPHRGRRAGTAACGDTVLDGCWEGCGAHAGASGSRNALRDGSGAWCHILTGHEPSRVCRLPRPPHPASGTGSWSLCRLPSPTVIRGRSGPAGPEERKGHLSAPTVAQNPLPGALRGIPDRRDPRRRHGEDGPGAWAAASDGRDRSDVPPTAGGSACATRHPHRCLTVDESFHGVSPACMGFPNRPRHARASGVAHPVVMV